MFNWDFSAIVAQQGFVVALLLAFLGGVVSSLTPCVYPMIPITVGVIGAKEAKNKWQSLFISLIFAAGIVLTYTTLGLVSSYTGQLIGKALQNRFLLAGFALVFFSMGLGLLGAFTFQMPFKVNQWVARLQGQGKFDVFLAGVVSGVVAAPCVGPVVVGLLAYVASIRQPVFGAALLFAFSLGLSLLFVVLGVFSSMLRNLPKQGPWLLVIEHTFGALLLGASFYYLSLALPQVVFEPLLIAGLVVFGFFSRLRRWFGAMASHVVFLVAMLVAGWLFVGSFMPRLSNQLGYRFDLSTHRATQEGPKIAWLPSLDNGLGLAQQQGRPIMVDFFAEWCLACKELDRYTYSDGDVIKLAESFINVKLDFTESTRAGDVLLRQYQVMGIPAILFFDSQGRELKEYRLDGFVSAKVLLKTMRAVLGSGTNA